MTTILKKIIMQIYSKIMIPRVARALGRPLKW